MRDDQMHRGMTRKAFLRGSALSAGALLLGAAGCAKAEETPEEPMAQTGEPEPAAETASLSEAVEREAPLPPAEPGPAESFGMDANVNVDTIDSYLGRGDTVYRDVRMIKDPADYAAIGGSPNLDTTIEGFRIVPFPYTGTLAPLPVSGAYDGDVLFDIEWGEGIEILSATPRYEESLQILEDVFPKDKNIVLMCGGGGYAGMMRSLLAYLGWDESCLYNIGGMWFYEGQNTVELIYYDDDGEPHFCLWRADEVPINFDELTPLA